MALEWLKNILLGVLLAAFAAALLLFPAESADAAREGLSLCFKSVLPALFPFFVLSSLLIESGAAAYFAHALAPVMRPLFGLSGAGAAALVLGLVGGYPVGARTAAELYRGGTLDKSEAERLLGFCSNGGPGFILGVCGSAALQSQRAGTYLYLVHVLAAALTGMALRILPPRAEGRRTGRPPAAPPANRKRAASFSSVVRDSFAAVWSVCGFVVLFAVVLRLVTCCLGMGAAETAWYGTLLGAIELTNGVLALSPGRGGFVRCAVLLGWGGLSVHAQTLSVLEDTGLSARRYFLGKTLQAALSAPLAWVVSGLLY